MNTRALNHLNSDIITQGEEHIYPLRLTLKVGHVILYTIYK